jgi:mannose-6-phosphate isomerase-like protein (cupin superfamily)
MVLGKLCRMLIIRWQAPITPSKEQLKMMMESEGLEPFEEEFASQVKITEHRHPFGEVRTVAEGELLFNIAGNQFLLREGDRVEIPSNTKHWHVNNGNKPCVCICAHRTI